MTALVRLIACWLTPGVFPRPPQRLDWWGWSVRVDVKTVPVGTLFVVGAPALIFSRRGWREEHWLTRPKDRYSAAVTASWWQQ